MPLPFIICIKTSLLLIWLADSKEITWAHSKYTLASYIQIQIQNSFLFCSTSRESKRGTFIFWYLIYFLSNFTSISKNDERCWEEIRHPPVILTGRWNIFYSKNWAGILVKIWWTSELSLIFSILEILGFILDFMEVGMWRAKLTNVELWPH